MPHVSRNGQLIHFEASGPVDAPPLLLIMGLGLSSRAWVRLPGRLAARFRVIVFDNRGTGLSGKLKGLARISDFADDAAAVLSASGVRAGNPAFVFGVSMGGMIAQELVLRHPDLVRSLVLGATFASWASSDKPALHVGLRLFGIHLFGHRAKHLLAALLVSEEFEKERPADFQQWLQQAGVGKGGALMRQLGAIAGHSTLGRLHKITCPTLLVTGTRDRLVPSENSRVLEARIPGARLVELRGAGHVFPLEREDETVRLLESHFLERSVDTTGTISRRNALM